MLSLVAILINIDKKNKKTTHPTFFKQLGVSEGTRVDEWSMDQWLVYLINFEKMSGT